MFTKSGQKRHVTYSCVQNVVEIQISFSPKTRATSVALVAGLESLFFGNNILLKITEVFLIYDADGNITSRVDKAKNLPVQFRLVQEKRGSKPRVYLFRTPERVAKQSRWVEEEYPWEERLWHRDGTSLMRTRLEASPFDVSVFTNSVASRKVRAAVFVSLSEDEKRAFGLLPKTTQIKLLCVSTRVATQFEKPEFSYEHLLKYIDHVCTTKQRREREAEERARVYKAMYAVERQTALALRDDDIHRESDMIDIGVEGFERTYYRNDGTLLALVSMLLQGRKIDSRIPIKRKYTQGELRKTDLLLRGLVELVDSHRMDWNILVLIYLHYENAYYTF